MSPPLPSISNDTETGTPKFPEFRESYYVDGVDTAVCLK